MSKLSWRIRAFALAVAALWFAGCNSSHLEPPEPQGRPALVDDGALKRIWVLDKQEEERQVGVGGGGSRSAPRWRSDTFFHFSVQAFDPLTARPLWRKRLTTLGDFDAQGAAPSRVIGSSVGAQLLGQDGELVWLLIGDAPLALRAHDGTIAGDGVAIERSNPDLKGLLPSEAKFYAFDKGLVLTTADARTVVIRGPALKASDYVPTPVPAPPVDRYANGRERIVPMLPLMGEIPLRRVRMGDRWLALYTDKEAADALDDPFGDRFRYPYSVLDEGASARRTFRDGRVEEARHFDDRFDRWAALETVPGSPVFLKGRLLKDASTGEAAAMASPAGFAVWHSTRIDQAGRLALTRLDASLEPVWKAELPLNETSTVNSMSLWHLPGHVVVMGGETSMVDDLTQRRINLVSIDLATGRWQGWDIGGERALP